MPQIKPYQSRVDAPGPVQQQRAEAVSIAPGLRSLGEGISQLGEGLQKRQAAQEMSTVSRKMSEFQVDNKAALLELQRSDPESVGLSGNSNPGDPSSVHRAKDFEDFRQEYDKKVEELRSSLVTADAANYLIKRNDEIATNFYDGYQTIQSELKGEKAAQDYVVKRKSDEQSLMMSVGTLEQKKEDFRSTLADATNWIQAHVDIPQSHKYKEVLDAQIKYAKAIISSAIQPGPNGRINPNGPQIAYKMLQDKDYRNALGFDGIKQVETAISQVENAQYIDGRRADILDRAREKKLTDKAISDYVPKLADGSASAQDIYSDPNIPDAAKQHLLLVAHQMTTKNNFVDYSLARSILDGIHAPDGDPRKINDLSQVAKYIGKGLDLNTYKTLDSELKKVQSPEYQADEGPRNSLLNKASDYYRSNPDSKDPRGDLRSYKFNQFLIQAEDLAAKKGIPASDLYKESSPNYMGKDIKTIKSQTMSEKIKETLKQRTGNYKVPRLVPTQSAPSTPPEEALKGRK